MSLIIALVLIAIVVSRIIGDDAKNSEYGRRKKVEDDAISEWESEFVDKVLEAKLESCIADEHNFDEVCDEVIPVLSQLECYSYLSDRELFLINERQVSGRSYKSSREILSLYRNIALDIMLAHRHKISEHAANYGYDAYLADDHLQWKKSMYEYAEMILKLMQTCDTPPKLHYRGGTHSGKYVWVGSFADRDNSSFEIKEIVLPFARTDIFKENPIPPIDMEHL